MEAVLNPHVPPTQLAADDLMQPFLSAFTPAPLWRVGTEAEKFGVLRESGLPIDYHGTRGVCAVFALLQERFGWYPVFEHDGGEIIALERGGESITLEPGGQVELSGAPYTSIHETAREWQTHLAELRAIGEVLGITWLGLGFHPFATPPQLPWVPKLRYAVMREYLPTRGERGLDMMRRTATVQANLDYANEADAMQKMRIALKLSPVITAMFANSPLYESQLSGQCSERARVWLDTDPDRTGLLPFMCDSAASFQRYIDWALDAPMFLVKRGSLVVRNTGQTFRAFMRDGFQGTHATLTDWTTHLGTLFPEVRLKKTIEIRGADGAPRDLVPALAALCKGFLYDDQARQKAEQLAERISPTQLSDLRPDVARLGLKAQLSGRALSAWAADLVEIAHQGLVRFAVDDAEFGGDETIHLAPLRRLIEHGQSPADALLAQLDRDAPLAPQVLALTAL